MRWFRTDLTAEPLAAHPGSASSREGLARGRRGRFRLEPIEQRILLSSDSIASELLGPLLDHETVDVTLEIAPIVQVIGTALSLESGTADADGSDGADANTAPAVGLADWTVDIGDESVTNSQEVVIATVSAVEPDGSDSGDQTSLPNVEDSDFVPSLLSGDELERGPPASSALSAEITNSISVASTLSAVIEDAGFPRVPELLLSDFHDGAWSRGPPEADYLQSTGTNLTPSATPLTSLLLDPIVAAAISRWNLSGLQPFGSPNLSTDISFTIANLAVGNLAEIFGNSVTIDETADGYGWFVDSTPNEDTEFSPVSVDAEQGIDLLTVVLHELGHAMGFVHPGESGLKGVEVMAGVLGEGVRRLPRLAEGTKLNDVFDVILATFDPVTPPTEAVFTNITALRLPNSVTVGTTPAGGADLQLEGLTLTFSELVHGTAWAGAVLVEAELGILFPGKLDIVIVDDNFGSPIRVASASSPVADGSTFSVTFTVNGDHSDLESGDLVGILNSNEVGFDDTDTGDSRTITVSASSYDESLDQTTITVIYNFDPGSAPWTGGSVIAVKKADGTDDADLDAVAGTIQLATGDDSSLLNFESLKAADLGWPKWLDIQITDLKLEFNDFRADDSDSAMRLDAAFLGFDTGNAIVNKVIQTVLKVEGSADGVIFDMDRLAEASRTAGGAIIPKQNPILNLSGISGLVTGKLLGSVTVGFIIKQVALDAAGNLTTNTNETEQTILYGAFKGGFSVGGTVPAGPVNKDGKPLKPIGGFEFGFNFAISALGPLQLFVYVDTPILLDPTSGLTITELRGGVRFNSTIEDLQVRPPFTATDGSATFSSDLSMPVEVRLTVPGHNLKTGDEFRITAASDPDLESSGPDNFVVIAVNGDDITYRTGGTGYESNPANYSFGGTIEVKKISISEPFDLRDPGFGSTKDLSLADWEAQLDQQVVNQARAGDSLWEVLFDDMVIEAGATLSFKPRIPEFLLKMEVDLLLDTNLNLLVTGTMVLVTALKIPVKLFGDFSEVGEGAITLLALMDVPDLPASTGIKPILVVYADVTFETLVNGVPASTDILTGFPAGIGANVREATITDLSPTGGGPWEVTFTLEGSDATTLFEVGDSIVVVGSRPDVFNGTYLVTQVTSTTVSFVIGSVLLDGLVDVDRSGTVDDADNGILGGIPIIGGRLDINKDETIDADDDGEIFNVVRDASGKREVVGYTVIDGYVDVDGDGVTNGNDDAVVGEDPTIWDAGFDLTSPVLDGAVDVDRNGVVDADDIGDLGNLRVIEGRLDMDRSGVIDVNDDGTFLNVIINSDGDRHVTPYGVIDGYLDINDDGVISAGDDLTLAMGTDLGGYWIADGLKVANQDDLGNGLRITVSGGVDLNIPFVTTLSLTGSATLDLIFGGAEDARLGFKFDMALSETTAGDIGRAAGEFTITLDVFGGPVIGGIPTPKVEIWGAALLDTDFSFLENAGLFADASAVLIINSTAADKPAVLLGTAGAFVSVVPTAQTFAMRLDGSIDFRIDFNNNDFYETSEQVFLLEGVFVLSFTAAQGFNVALFSEPSPGLVGPAILKIGSGSTPLLQFTAFGFMAIRSNGIAANIVVGLSAGGPFADFASVSGQFVFMVNTTGADITFIIPAGTDSRTSSAGLTVSIPRAPPGSIADASLDVFSLIAGTAWTVPAGTPGTSYVLIVLGGTNAATDPDAILTVGGDFELRGKFAFLAGIDTTTSKLFFELQVNASMELHPLNGLLLASGSLKINDDGVVGSLAIGGELVLEPLTIVGAFTLEVNTTDESQTVQRYEFDFIEEEFQRNSSGDLVVQNITITPHTIRLFAFAKFELTGSFLLQGSVSFTNSPTLLSLAVNMTMDFFGAQLSVEGEARIVKAVGSEGLVLRLSASASAFGVPGIFSITGNLELRINTRPLGVLDENDLGLARQSFRVQVSGASLSLVSVITLTGSGFVEMTQGVFRMEASVSGNFLSVASVSASVFLSSEGEFRVQLTGSVSLGTTGFSISGSADLVVSLLDDNGIDALGTGPKVLNVAGSLTVTGTLFFISLPEVEIGVAYNSSTGAITVSAGPVPVPGIAYRTVTIPFVGTVKIPYPIITLKFVTFTIGTLKLGPPPPPALLGQVVGGQLTLNVGPDAGARNLQEDEINESVLIEGLGDGTTTGQKIKITMFGVSNEFDNVTNIRIADMAAGSDFVQIADTVHIPIEVHFGDDTDTLESAGSGAVIAHGDAGDDFLTGGTGNDQLFGGAGDDVIQGGPGNDQMNGGGDSDLLTWDAGDGSDALIDGQSGDDALNIRGTDSSEEITVQANASGTGFTVVVDGQTLIVGGIEGANIEGRGGSDTFAINGLGSSLLSLVTVQLGADTDADSVTVNGSDSADIFNVSTEVVSLTTVDPDGAIIVVDVDVLQFSRTSGITVNVFDATTSGGDTITLDTMDGDDTINVLSLLAGAPTTVNGGDDSDTIHVGNLSGLAAPLTINGNAPSSGSDVLNVDDSGDTLGNAGTLTSTTITGLGLGPAGIVYGGIEHLNISMGSGPDSFTILSTAVGTETTINANNGADTFNVRTISGTTTIDGGNDADTFNVGSLAPATGGTVNGIAALLELNGNGSSDVLNVDETGDPGSNSGTLTSSAISGLGMAGSINYGTIETVTVNLGSGDDTLNVQSTSVFTNVNTGTGSTANSINVGNGNLNGIVGNLVVHGQSTGNDTLNVDDTGDTTPNVGTVTSTTLIGLGLGDSIAYTSIDTLNISLGSGGNTFNVRSTSALTTVNTGTGANTVNVGSAAPATGGNVNSIAGKLVINGQGSDTLNVDETGESSSNTGTLTNTRLTGLGMAGGDAAKGIQYAGVDALNINLGAGADTLTIESASFGTVTTINANNGDDTLNVRTIAGTTTIDGGNDSDTFNVGSLAPATGGTVDGIAALLELNGNGSSDVLNVDETGDGGINTGTLTSTSITGLGMAGSISYGTIETVTVNLGSGSDTFTVQSTSVLTTVNTGTGSAANQVNAGNGNLNSIVGKLVVNGQSAGVDTLNVDDTGDATSDTGLLTSTTLTGLGLGDSIAYTSIDTLNISLGSGGNTFNVRSTSALTTVNTGTGANTVNVGSAAPATGGNVNGIAGKLVVNGQGSDTLNVDETGDSGINTGTLTNTRLTGLGMAGGDATKGIEYAGVDTLNINLGTGADTLTIESTSLGTATTINANNGDDTLNVRTIAGTTTIDGGNDSDTFNVGSLAPATGGTVNGIAALLTLNGNEPSSGSDVLNVDDSGDSLPNVGTLTSSTISGLGISPAGIVYGGMEHLTISLGSGGDTFTIDSTHGSTTPVFDEETTVNMGAGIDTVHINDVTDLLVVNGDGDGDTVHVNGTGAESTSTLHGNTGNDIFNVRAMNGDVNISGDDGDDTVNVGSDAPALPLFPTTEAATVDAINGLLTVDGGAGSNDVLNVDDSDPADDAKTGTLTASTIRGLELEQGVDYSNLDRLHIWLAFGDNTFNINSTHAGETTVNTAQGEDTVNVNDTAAGSVTTLNGESGDNIFNIRGMDGRVHVWGGTGNDTVNVADTGQNLGQIQGPLILEDGNAPDADAELGTIDTLNVFHANNNDADTGRLFYRTMSGAIANPGLALTGFGMGGDSGGYGGGITYNGFEIVEVLLGTGNESLDIDDTGDRDEKAALANDPAAITAIHGSGGNDTITITNRGNGPLVVYGDTGEDTVNASAMAAKTGPFVGIVIYGGPDNDILTGTQDDDQLAGGSGTDTINGEAGADHIYGDSHITVDLQLFTLDQIERFDIETDLSLINAMLTVTTSGAGDADSINGGNDSDIIFGDHGVIGQIVGVRRIESTGSMILLQTDNVSNGAGDNIYGGAGNDFAFGGAGNDTIYGDLGSDLILGDHGMIAGDVDASAIGQIDGAGVVNPSAVFLYTSDSSPAADASAGNDTIYGGSLSVLDTDSGKNILLGQQGSDTIYGGASEDDIYGGHNVANGADAGDFIDGAAGSDVILGDNGLIERTAAATDPRFTVLTGAQIYDPFGNALVADGDDIGANPAGVEARLIQLFDHDDDPTANTGNFGDDIIAGGVDDDVIFGQLGDDMIHGGAGDDYIEGNGGDDTIFGGAGQDDIVGGSSELYSLGDPAMRPDGADTIFGGNGDMASRNNGGDAFHGNDSDAILGDNGNVLRLVGISGADGGSFLQFAYDNYSGAKIVVRALALLDYTPGGPDFSGDASFDIGNGDEIHGESGDDFIYGQKGDDVLFGDAQDDDLLGGYGNDWISGGTGDDGVIGDDGRIYTSRNGTAEPLNGVVATTQGSISTAGNFQQATTDPTGQLKKAVDLTPFSQDPGWGATADEFNGASTHTSDDVIYGGLGNDWLHGGSGDDAISGAEALLLFYTAPSNPGNALGYSLTAGTFAAYDEFSPMANIPGFLLNFESGEGPATGTVFTDGDDKIFGDLGNDWLVGGTGRDDIYGGWGSDLMNADDDQTTNGGLNDQPDNQPSYEDRTFGGAGIDVLIGNTGGDRLIDWVGDFNSYIVPFTSNTMGTISRTHQPQLAEFLYALSKSAGADPTRAADTGSSSARNGEPFGELGVIVQHDFAWHDQTGALPEVQLGSIPTGPREVLMSANFNGPATTTAGGFSTISGFSPDSGTWTVEGGALQVSAESLGGDAVSVLEVGAELPSYFEIQASVLAIKPTGGWEANSFIVFDYQGRTDFKFAGIDVSTNKLVMGHRNAGGWHVDQQAPVQGGLKADKYYNLLLSVNGVNATLVVDNQLVFTHTYLPRVVEGYSYGLNWGIVGVGSNNARGAFDNIQIQILPPQLTFDQTEDFAGAPTLSFTEYTSGHWSVGSGVYTSSPDGASTLSLLDLGPDNLAVSSYLELSAKVNTTAGLSGFVFDRYPDGSFKFAAIDAATDQVIIGHYTTKSGWVSDAVLSMVIHAGTSYTLGVALQGTTVSLTLDGQTLLGHTFNAATVDGNFGLLNTDSFASFDDVRVKTNDPEVTAAA